MYFELKLDKLSLCPQDLVVKLLINALMPSDETSLIIVDGFPRTKTQLEHFNRLVCTAISSESYTNIKLCCYKYTYHVIILVSAANIDYFQTNNNNNNNNDVFQIVPLIHDLT